MSFRHPKARAGFQRVSSRALGAWHTLRSATCGQQARRQGKSPQAPWGRQFPMYENIHAGLPGSTVLSGAAATSRKAASERSSDAALLIGGAGGLALGSFLPWEAVTAPFFGTITANGMQAGGLFTLASAP